MGRPSNNQLIKRSINFWKNKHKHLSYSYDNVNMNTFLKDYINLLPPIKSFLDHGCGHGRISEMICDKYPNINITINDITSQAVDITENKINNRCNLIKTLGPLHHISDSFDCIISHRVIHSCPNFKQVFREIYRLLSNNGSCFISVRSSQCIDSVLKRQYINNENIIIGNHGRFTKLFSVDEFNTNLGNSNFHILKHGDFTEESAKSGKTNKYLYAICQKK